MACKGVMRVQTGPGQSRNITIEQSNEYTAQVGLDFTTQYRTYPYTSPVPRHSPTTSNYVLVERSVANIIIGTHRLRNNLINFLARLSFRSCI